MNRDQNGKNAVTLTRNGLTVECFFRKNGRLERKIERYGRQFTEYAYLHDAAGHLLEVRRDGKVTEQYTYTQSGQRAAHLREYRGFSDSTGGTLRYDDEGRLVRAGDTAFEYDENGALAERRDGMGVTRYWYGRDTMPDTVSLASGVEIRYEYDAANPTGPARRFRNGVLAAEYIWSDPLHLAGYVDHDNELVYSFFYDQAGVLDRVRLDALGAEKLSVNGRARRGMDTDWAADSADWLGSMAADRRRYRLQDFLETHPLPCELLCGCDQVGTLKVLTDTQGVLVKEVMRDSFGLQQGDSFPDLFMPIGFAGGLVDPDTGLVRFGYRDYDPAVGRFTAPDPLGDTGGDHDVYDYCIDDPVTMNDPSGLLPPLLLFLGAKALALGIAGVGTYFSAKTADAVGSARSGKESTRAVDAVKKVAPMVAGASAAATAASALPAAAVMGPGAVTAAGQRVGAAIHASKYGDTIVKAAPHVKDFVEGAVMPGPPAMTAAGGAGYIAGEAYKKAKARK